MLLSINVLRSYQDQRLYYSAFSQSRHCSQQINKDLPAGLDLSVEHLTAAWEVMGSIPKARPKLRILMRIKVLPLPSKCLDFPMAQIQDSKLKFDFGSTCATRCKFLGAQLKILGAQLIMLSLIHISEPTRRTPISYAVFCLKKNSKLTTTSVSNENEN